MPQLRCVNWSNHEAKPTTLWARGARTARGVDPTDGSARTSEAIRWARRKGASVRIGNQHPALNDNVVQVVAVDLI